MTTKRAWLLWFSFELIERVNDLRCGQLLANVATLALGTTVGSIWDVGDDDLVDAAKQLFLHFRQPTESVA